MVYVVIVNNRPYAYQSVRVPGRKHPVKQYIGPAGDDDVVLLLGLQRIKKRVRRGVAAALPTPWSTTGEGQLVDAVVDEFSAAGGSWDIREATPATEFKY